MLALYKYMSFKKLCQTLIKKVIYLIEVQEDVRSPNRSISKSHLQEKDGIINKTFMQIIEFLRYDIDLTYVRRRELLEKQA